MPLSFTGETIQGDPREKVVKLEAIYGPALAARRARETEWRQNILFLRGRQWESVDVTPRGSRRIEYSAPSTKVKITANHIYPLARQASAHLVDNISQPIATPSTSEPEDVYAAEIATDLLVFRQSEDREEEIRRIETLWAMCCGIVARYTAWDPDKASYLPVGRVEGAGEVDTMMLNPWQFILSPWARSPRESEFVILPDVRTVEEIADIYGTKVEAEGTSTEDWLLERDMMGMISDSHGSGKSFETPKGAAVLKRMFVAPSKRQPKGRVYTWANGVFLDESELPEGELPLEYITWFPAPGSPYPLPFVSPLIDLQREINITYSQLVELKNRQLRGDMVVRGIAAPREESQDDRDEDDMWSPAHDYYDSVSGRKIVYLDAMTQEFEFIKYDLNPTEAESLLSRLYSDMLEAAGIHESSLGKQQPSGTPATTTLALKESDLSGLTIFRSGFNLSHARIGRKKLIVARNHYQVPRTIRIVGKSNAVKVADFMGADLRSTEDVKPNTEPMLTESEKNNIRAQLVAQMAYGPYAGPKDQLAKVRMILTSGLPEARDEAEKQCAPMSIEDLERIVGEIHAGEAELALAQIEAAQRQLEAVTSEGEESPEDDMMANMPPEVQMMMGMGGGQMQPGQQPAA